MPFEKLISQATVGLTTAGFAPLDEGGGERHGAWEWVWSKPRGAKGHSYVTLAALDPAPGFYFIEVWAGADNGVHFGRYLVSRFPASRVEAIQTEESVTNIVDTLKNAAEIATVLTDTDLTGTYVRGL